ncbi:MAG: hypothetical protein OJJ54_13620 [Pseudonocardia sp.]|nr:hypothetical protein [Pseudonocardia sp.]
MTTKTYRVVRYERPDDGRVAVYMPDDLRPASDAGGTLSSWFRRVGDRVEMHEPILEAAYEHVDLQMPTPVAGTIVEINVQAGERFANGQQVAVVQPD